MIKCLKIVQKPSVWWFKIILFVLLCALFLGRVQAQSNNDLFNLGDGALSPELWEVVLGDLDDWQMIGGRLQGHLLPPPTVSNYISAITPRPQFWSVTGNYQLAFDYIALDEADKNLAILFDYHFNDKGKILLSYLSFHFVAGQLFVENFQENFLTRKAIIPYKLIPGKTYRVFLLYQKPNFSLFIDEKSVFSSKDLPNFWPDFLEPGRPLFYLSKGKYSESAVIFANFKFAYHPQLSVPYFSQLDSNWASEIYDHSQEFFDPPLTIASSGCALTSAAMLLNYYGYETFPDQDNWSSELRGKSINPETLNLWLKNEADGYVGAALVNWLAITRLTSLLAESEADAEVVLEFSYADYQEKEITEQLSADQPLIADLDGHFVLMTGISDDNQDLTNHYLINDPLSINSTLDQQQTPIKSLRLFKPSQTDLSYWLLISPEDLEFHVIGENQKIFKPVLVRENNLLNPAQAWFLYYWSKPESGNYFWQFSLADLDKLKLAQLFVYQSNGQVQIFNLADYLARELQLNFTKDQLSELLINQEKKIFLHYHRYLLNNLLRLQNEQLLLGKVQNVYRYQQLIEKFLVFYQL